MVQRQSFGLAVAIASAACRPADSAPAEPEPSISDIEPSAAMELPGDPLEHHDVRVEEGFVVTLASRCRDTWNGILVQSAARKGHSRPTSSGWERNGFAVPNASNRELQLRSGDALLLTSPQGGIMELSFDEVAAGDGARVELTAECNGVKKTVVHNPPSRTSARGG